jgi:hypothetical protein
MPDSIFQSWKLDGAFKFGPPCSEMGLSNSKLNDHPIIYLILGGKDEKKSDVLYFISVVWGFR